MSPIETDAMQIQPRRSNTALVGLRSQDGVPSWLTCFIPYPLSKKSSHALACGPSLGPTGSNPIESLNRSDLLNTNEIAVRKVGNQSISFNDGNCVFNPAYTPCVAQDSHFS